MAAALGGGCNLTRPKGAYEPPPLNETVITYDGGAVASQEDASIVGVPPTEGGVADPDSGTATDPRSVLQGDYMVLFKNVSTTQDPQLGQIKSTTTTRAVMRVVLQDDKLTATEWLCSSDNRQEAEKGTVSTSFDDKVWNAFTPVTREVKVDVKAGTWQTTQGTRRQGWTPVTSQQMPTDPNKQPKDFLDPEKDDSPGVRVTIAATVKPVIGPQFSATCKFDLVAFTTSHYSGGSISDGELTGAQVKLDDSKAHAWRLAPGSSSACNLDQINKADDPDINTDELSMVRLDDWLMATDKDPKPCPSSATFDRAFP